MFGLLIIVSLPNVFVRAGIKAIKLHAWEAPFERRINHLRKVELQQIRQALRHACIR